MILEGNDEWDPNTTTRRTSVSLRYQLVVNLSAVTVNVNVGRCGFSPAVSILEDSVKNVYCIPARSVCGSWPRKPNTTPSSFPLTKC